MDEIIKKIRQSWEENPLQTAAVGAFVVTAAAKLLDAIGGTRRRRTWDREVARRERMDRQRRR